MSQPGTPNVEWTKATSDRDKEYQVGLPVGSEADPNTGVTPKSSISFDVNWTVGDPSEWIDTPEDFKRVTGITRYKLFKSIGGDQSGCTLAYTNDVLHHYKFTEKSADIYGQNPFKTGDHFLHLDSVNPTIVRVEGE